MLACISCSKQVAEGEEEEGGRNKEAVKSLTSQIKEMALKQKPTATSSTTYKRDHRQYPDFDTVSETAPYPYNIPGSSSSTPAWDPPSTGQDRHAAGSSSDAHFTGGLRRDGVSARSNVTAEDENDGPKVWVAQVEPGVHITFMSLPNGGNDLKRIRFSREMFDKWQAQRWWGENYDRILELYNVQRFNRQALQTPARSEDERDSSYSRMESPMMTPASTRDWMPRHYYKPGGGSKGHYYPPGHDGHPNLGSNAYGGARGEKPSFDGASQVAASERDEPSVSMSNASEIESEWVEEDEPGVYITIRQLIDGTKELRRVRFR
uniref:BRX domain-containing protein n=2 Tax=Kalanchoe fedtschenkoi TaxID=63787 RepID=A0A7N0V517_KALFE